MTVADLDIEKKQYLEKFQEKLDDIQKRKVKEKNEAIDRAASNGQFGQPNFQLILDPIDKKYADEKRLAENEKERFLEKNRLDRAKLSKSGKK